MGQNSGYKNCGSCHHIFKVGPQHYVCRRYPPIGQIAQSRGPILGTTTKQAYVSFYPPISIPMVCGEWKKSERSNGADNDNDTGALLDVPGKDPEGGRLN